MKKFTIHEIKDEIYNLAAQSHVAGHDIEGILITKGEDRGYPTGALR